MKRAGNDLTSDEAGKRVQGLLLDTVLALARIKVFRSTNRQAVEHGRQLFEDESQKFLLTLQKDGIIGSPEIVTSPEARRDFCRNHADTLIRDCRAAADAATLVFVHSLLDIHTTECLEILIGFHPLNWSDEVKNEKVALDRLQSGGVDEVVRDEVRKYKTRLFKESIMKRIEALHRHCKPLMKHTIQNELYTYDADRIGAFDKKRHDIIHEADIRVGGFDLDSEILYVERTCIYLGLLVGDGLSIQWNFNQTLDQYFSRQ